MNREPGTEERAVRPGARARAVRAVLAASALAVVAIAVHPARPRADEPVITPAGYRTVVEHVMLPGGVIVEYDEYVTATAGA